MQFLAHEINKHEHSHVLLMSSKKLAHVINKVTFQSEDFRKQDNENKQYLVQTIK